ncbi:MAG TPA: glycerophosphodiester phosphodiesterase family protein [Methylomirabilota bacterium]|nr:glycerophosphodiester phosphodiesterase family protein [Methylomirabilota bacterium]
MRTAVTLFVLALAFAALPAAGAGPRVAAHRGGALLWVENSLGAYRKALELGVDYVETDVHLTADGDLVVVHDATLDRTTSGTGTVREARRDELSRLRLRARDGSLTDEPLPTLGALLDVVRPSRAELLLEIKVDERGRRYPGIEEKVLALLRERALSARTLIMAFEPDTLRRVRELDPAVRTVLLINRGRVQHERVWPAAAVTRAVELGAAAVGFNHRLVDADVTAAARRAGLVLAAWTVNEEADLSRVIALGVDVVISDRPDLALRLTGR